MFLPNSFFSKFCLTATALNLIPNGILKSSPQNENPRNRLNIVLFVADDLGARDISPYGNKVVRTPNLKGMASQSMVFTKAFASSPTSAPSRASLHTGLMPFRNGAHANHTGLKGNIRTLPSYLKTLGYEARIAGKLHLGPMRLYHFDLIHGSNTPEPGYEGKGVLWTDLNMQPVDGWLAEKASTKQPFVLVVNDHSPHVIWPEKATYNPSEVDIPAFLVETDETRQSRARYYTDITKMDDNVGKLLTSLKKYQLDENTIVIFTADQGPQWPFGKWNLYDYGIQVPLMIKWPGIIKKTSFTGTLISLVDILPTIIDLAGGTPPTGIDGISLRQILTGEKKSVHEYIYASHTGDGTTNQSPMRMIRTEKYKYIFNLASETEYHTHIDRFTDHNEYWPSWEIRSFENEHAAAVLWKYHNRPKEELYDLDKDPLEQVNLAGKAVYTDVIKKFRTEMLNWRNNQEDYEAGIFVESKKNNKEVVAPYIFN